MKEQLINKLEKNKELKEILLAKREKLDNQINLLSEKILRQEFTLLHTKEETRNHADQFSQ